MIIIMIYDTWKLIYFVGLLKQKIAWMFGKAPPWAIVTPDNNYEPRRF